LKITFLDPKLRQKMSDHTKGENNPFYGKTHSKECKEKMKDRYKRRFFQCNETGEVFDSLW